MKKCSRCKEIKSKDSFRIDKHYKDGYCSWCKECKKEYNRSGKQKIWKKNYDKKYYQNNKEHHNKLVINWQKQNRELYLEIKTKARKKYIKKYPEKVKAHEKISNAIKTGKLAKHTCEICGNFLAEAHHPDYSKPLEVIFLCKKHHLSVHKGEISINQIYA